jgi:hypothetical protein
MKKERAAAKFHRCALYTIIGILLLLLGFGSYQFYKLNTQLEALQRQSKNSSRAGVSDSSAPAVVQPGGKTEAKKTKK